jgi:chorismate mutase
MKVAIQGIAGSFHDIAARRFYGEHYPQEPLEIVECKTFEETFDSLAKGESDAAMVAIENSIAGSIPGNYNLLEKHSLFITGEIYVRIQHHLVALPGQKLEDIHTVLGHPVAIPQCLNFLNQHPQWEVQEYFDTASSCRRIRDEKLIGFGAIAGYAAANLYGMDILAERIEDQEHNYTRFLALSRERGTGDEGPGTWDREPRLGGDRTPSPGSQAHRPLPQGEVAGEGRGASYDERGSEGAGDLGPGTRDEERDSDLESGLNQKSKIRNLKSKDHSGKSSLSLRVSHRSGSLAEALMVLKHHHINLSKIQSVAVVDVPFEYAIHLDLLWDDIRDYKNSIAVLRERSLEIREFGVYRRGESDVESMAQTTYPSAITAPAAQVQEQPGATQVPATNWKDWTLPKSCQQPEFLLIAGPCSAESEEQLIETARELKKTGWPCALRAGIWKPRTRAGGFEGHGVPALEWLREAKREFGMPVAVEVAGASHVEACLRYGVDIVWVGARTTGNPFSVQEIAEALRGTDTIVMVKNPISPDVELWIGAVERLAMSGINRLGAIHRGFASGVRSGYRNPPEWSLALQFRERLPQIPLICDPSHIMGKRDGLQEVSQRAIDAGMDGLMVEVHRDPSEAWTDAAQQLTPAAYAEMMSNLTWRPTNLEEDGLSGETWSKLETLRTAIDRLDHELIELLASRMNVVQEIGEYKKLHGLEVLQAQRWNSIMERRLAQSERLNLNPHLVRTLFEEVHHESMRLQEIVKDGAA